ncbi:uncharacterized protein B0J16DRAFT_319752 [Fusarium flagelliforme]|uniref:Uncharacterized protein n=1 Tax=Fusarium flagelliforme TaxID=2675880 RepID=A0A395MJ57_9HYPO|nr:uncharacterized protein B0J16DRAFT_319752 [Fusarium flagelliforme]KAH7184951.1 hypothetical protein B0J16DRAFT_319752 [Fusarium flagelliforme]RFN47968.1 hypothetical protein FIE12Z_7691 [Fusarium flagelliforme]
MHTEATKKLLWYFDESLEDSIFVLDNKWDPSGPRQPYAQRSPSGDIVWHPISEEPLTDPTISCIDVRSSELYWWPDDWSESHRHADPDFDWCVFEFAEEGVRGRLLECCGEVRPQDHVPLRVEASTRPYVTVHDYLAAVHPWILNLREKILSVTWSALPPDDGSRVVLNYNGIDSVSLTSEKSWNFLKHPVPYTLPEPDPNGPWWSGMF